MTKSGKHCDKRRNCTFCAISFFCYHVFKKLSAAEAPECVYMRERVNKIYTMHFQNFQMIFFPSRTQNRVTLNIISHK